MRLGDWSMRECPVVHIDWDFDTRIKCQYCTRRSLGEVQSIG